MEANAWRAKNFPEARDGIRQALGVCEEAGEIAHHVLKLDQGIRGNEGHVAEIADGIGDVVIYLTGLADYYGLDVQNCVMDAWAQVKNRDWIKNPETGE